jgi:RimK family alpha-L-glutamate ligase
VLMHGASHHVSVPSHGLEDFDLVLVRTMPPGSLEQVIFRMDCLEQLSSRGIPVVNSPKCVEISVDKYRCLAKLQHAGLPVPRSAVAQSFDQAMEQFEWLGRDVIVKPIFGSEGRGVTRICDEDFAVRSFKLLAQLGAVIYQQEFVAHGGEDYRLFVLGDRVWGMKRSRPGHWKTNVSLGAKPLPHQPTEVETEMALRAAHAVDAKIAGVDLLYDAQHQPYLIEVNAVPGWQGLSKVTGECVSSTIFEFLRTQAKS